VKLQLKFPLTNGQISLFSPNFAVQICFAATIKIKTNLTVRLFMTSFCHGSTVIRVRAPITAWSELTDDAFSLKQALKRSVFTTHNANELCNFAQLNSKFFSGHSTQLNSFN
jgi:hypothetical protein